MASEPLAGGLFVVVGLSDDRRAVVLLVVLVVFFVLIVIVVGMARRHRVHEAPLDQPGEKALEDAQVMSVPPYGRPRIAERSPLFVNRLPKFDPRSASSWSGLRRRRERGLPDDRLLGS